MNFSTVRSHLGQFYNYITSVIHRFGNSCSSQRCQVHPEIGIDKSLEFIDLGSKRIVRIIHVLPNSWSRCQNTAITAVREKSNEERRAHMHLDISSEEYWFARANRPYKQCDDCNRNPRPCGDNNVPANHGVVTHPSGNVNNQIIVVGNIIAKSIDLYADSLSREVIDSAFHSIFNSILGFDIRVSRSPSKKSNHTPNGVNGLKSPNDDVVLPRQNQESERLNVYPASHDDLSDGSGMKRLIEQSEINETGQQCKGGIINLSFSGSLSEPDEIRSSGDDYPQLYNASLVSSSPIQYKFEVSNPVNGRTPDSGSGTHKHPDNETDEAGTFSGRLIDVPENGIHDNDKTFASKDDLGNESVVPSGNEGHSDNSVSSSHFDVHEAKTQVFNDKGKVGIDGCVHNKNTQKPLLLFLHGVGSSADVWSVMLEYFSSAGYEVLAPDMLGHGYSSAPNNRAAYTFEKLLQDVLQIFDRYVSDNQKCVAIGHSYGSCFAAALARYRPQQISQLVLLSSGGPSPLVPKQTLFSLHPCVVSVMRPFLMCGFKREVFYAPRGKQLPSFCTYELPPYVMNHVERGQEWSDGDSAFHRRILVPTLLVHGLKDPHISLVEECEMERTIPRSFLEVLPNAGHMQMLDAPEQLCHMIHCFITWWNS
ncbi:uncharacterized protein LOC124168866 [Ischnura elegans]|uniref:uncharacterized protein LOC124168866 n=1 Tax=Ischnura elegans TaxID=197161 RepID=UPI001ED872D5|nr:uncharacterized protein LOC124168866 [Ischnura elegans]